jgi:hypothetical protein
MERCEYDPLPNAKICDKSYKMLGTNTLAYLATHKSQRKCSVVNTVHSPMQIFVRSLKIC